MIGHQFPVNFNSYSKLCFHFHFQSLQYFQFVHAKIFLIICQNRTQLLTRNHGYSIQLVTHKCHGYNKMFVITESQISSLKMDVANRLFNLSELVSLQAAHVNGQMTANLNKRNGDNELGREDPELPEEGESYRCLWDGCKVFDMISSSRSWLEKHVPTHGGKFAYVCIVSGCKMRFSTQVKPSCHIPFKYAFSKYLRSFPQDIYSQFQQPKFRSIFTMSIYFGLDFQVKNSKVVWHV